MVTNPEGLTHYAAEISTIGEVKEDKSRDENTSDLDVEEQTECQYEGDDDKN